MINKSNLEMGSTDKTKEMLENELKTIQENGIQADRKNMKRNMHTQFADPFEFAREYVVNSYDAMATECYISGRENDNSITVTIRDNGKGMDFQRIQDYFKIFRSRKDNTEIKAIGRFGVGKMSVAAVPGLILLSGITSTGKECWRFETDSLIDDRPVKIQRIEPVPSKGTKFEITIKKTMTLSELLTKIYEILCKYVRHLDINVFFDLPELDDKQNPLRKKLPKGHWKYSPNSLGKQFVILSNGIPVDVVLGIGNPEHELYQNKIYITSKYNLISADLEKEIKIPNLMVRVNSEVFELTFGRHCLSNESILPPLTKEIREITLPQYFNYLIKSYNEDLLIHYPEIIQRIDEMVVGLLAFNPSHGPWSNFPLFKMHDNSRRSFLGIRDDVEKKGLIYIEASENEGTDYSSFNAPVIKQDQPDGGLDLIRKAFGPKVIDLNLRDTVIEIMNSDDIVLSEEEKKFENFLAFQSDRDVLERLSGSRKNASNNNTGSDSAITNPWDENLGICEEARVVQRDFCSLTWKVNYLVERDGKTSCFSRKFLISGNKIILNLFHPEIREFVELSCVDASLSAHWAMAMCLSDPKMLPHITPDAREDILLIDAMSRINHDKETIETPAVGSFNKQFFDFVRNCRNKLSDNGFSVS